jgi:hypothetical protein
VAYEAAREADHDDLTVALTLAVWYPHPKDPPRYVDRDTGEIRVR